jgi:hypothetical protein
MEVLEDYNCIGRSNQRKDRDIHRFPVTCWLFIPKSPLITEREKSLLHVAATRAKEDLRLSWSGPKSDLLP